MPDETSVTVTDLQAIIQRANVDSFRGQWIIKRFCLRGFGRVAFVYCLSVCVQQKSKSSERILTKFSEKVSNDKICNCAAIPCTLVQRYSESPAVPPPKKDFSIWGDGKKISSPQTLHQVSGTGISSQPNATNTRCVPTTTNGHGHHVVCGYYVNDNALT